ncbi:MAG: DUF302 domain-containing protein [Pseudomonadota bacterium]
MMRTTIIAAALALAITGPAAAEMMSLESPDSVGTTMDRLQAAVENAGATVFARVNHGAGAASVDMELADAELLVFGNPMLGTPALQDDLRAGLLLPLRVLVHAEGDGSVLIWEDPVVMFEGLEIAEDAPYIARMRGALGNLTKAAADGM